MDHVLGDGKDVSYDMLSELKYLEQVLKESLRLYPSVPFFGRELTEDVVLEGVAIPAGTIVDIQVSVLHRDPANWENPNDFKPERWENEAEERDPYAYIPFSAGPRNWLVPPLFFFLRRRGQPISFVDFAASARSSPKTRRR